MGNDMETVVQKGLSRDLRKQIMPTWGPKVGGCYLHWAGDPKWCGISSIHHTMSGKLHFSNHVGAFLRSQAAAIVLSSLGQDSNPELLPGTTEP